jgi:HEPN domain-containing protein
MLTAREELTQGWLTKALHDLATARKAASEPDPYLDTAIYHCQQAAEKAVKGFLAFHNQPPVRTHDIELLLSVADPIETGFATWSDAAERLTQFATLYRYPGDVMEPDQAEFDQALQDAEGLFQFVLTVLPVAVHPVPR